MFHRDEEGGFSPEMQFVSQGPNSTEYLCLFASSKPAFFSNKKVCANFKALSEMG